MDRRTFLKTAATCSVATGMSASLAAAERYFPSKVDPALFETINRVKDPAKKSPLEKKHAPVIVAPPSVKAGEEFTVEVSVGESLHDMGPAHWIEYIDLAVGNEPAGRIEFQPKGYLKPRASFTVVVLPGAAPSGKVTLVASERCNIHAYWEAAIDIVVT